MPALRRVSIMLLAISGCLVFAFSAFAQSTFANVPTEWQTFAEQTQYRETPRYQETVAFAKRLASSSPLLRFVSFGKSAQGRELPLLVASTGGTFTPESARKAGKAVMLVQACIHP